MAGLGTRTQAGSRPGQATGPRGFPAVSAPLAKCLGQYVQATGEDLPELLNFDCPKHLWKKVRTTNLIERCLVEVGRRTRPMVVFVNIRSVDRIIYAIFQRFNHEWKDRTLKLSA